MKVLNWYEVLFNFLLGTIWVKSSWNVFCSLACYLPIWSVTTYYLNYGEHKNPKAALKAFLYLLYTNE